MRRAMILAIAAYVPVAVLVLGFHRLGLPGVWVALGLWLGARAFLLGRRWQAQFSRPGQPRLQSDVSAGACAALHRRGSRGLR